MTIEEAIKTALEYENHVVTVYAEAVASTADSRGKQVLEVLADEERGHVGYLERALLQWQQNGRITAENLHTAIPSEETIRRGVEKLRAEMANQDRAISAEAELDILAKALEVETRTSDFYKSVVEHLSGDAKGLFARFVQIEEGHRTIVQAEIDAVTGTGYWFDFREFSLEAA